MASGFYTTVMLSPDDAEMAAAALFVMGDMAMDLPSDRDYAQKCYALAALFRSNALSTRQEAERQRAKMAERDHLYRRVS
ncbi:MAG: hypothetical protein AMS20_00155 [Gemmatimonas sp. SG8_28]|nr:MAG: hypothetical protein AMS20_00155 [Gemmatimonas sp. SG8_28]